MSAFLHIIAAVAVGATLCIAARNDQDSNETQEDQSGRLLGVTHNGHFVSSPVSRTRAPLHPGDSGISTDAAKSTSKRHRRQRNARHPLPAFALGQLAVETEAQPGAKAVTFVKHRHRKRGRAKGKHSRSKDRRARHHHALFSSSWSPENAVGNEGSEEGQDDDDEKERAEALAEARVLTDTDKFQLELGWLLEVFLIAGIGYWIYKLWPYRSSGDKYKDLNPVPQDTPEHDESVPPHPLTLLMYESFWGQNSYSYLINAIIIVMSLLNFIFFALETEVYYTKEKPELYFGKTLESWVPETKLIVEKSTVLILGQFIVCRAIGSFAHPYWKNYEKAAPVAFLMGDVFTHVEIVALLPTTIDTLMNQDKFLNLCWLSLIRTVEMMSRQGSIGAALRQWEALKEEKPIIRMVFGYASFAWVIMSGFYYIANQHNEASEWEAVKYKDSFWQRFNSIPSSMFFVLINLSCEYPLADSYQTGLQRLFAMMACIIGVPMFAIPTGIVGNALQDHTASEIDQMKVANAIQDQPQYELGRGNAEDAEPEVTGSDRSGEAETTVDRLLPFEDEGAAVEKVVWILSFGSVIVYFFYTACLVHPEHQTHIFGLQFGVTAFNFALLDGFVGLVFCLHMAYEVKEGYFFTFPFVVDFLSSVPAVLHFFMVVGHANGPVSIDLLRACCIMRVFKPDRYIGAFRVMFEILDAHRPLLAATGYVSFMMLIGFSTALFYTERDNPDEEIREYYGSAARAIWAELINLHGEWVLCDFTAHGKAICTFIDFIAIGICMVPIVIFTNGYAERLQSNSDETSLTMKPWQFHIKPEPDEEDTPAGKLYKLFYQNVHPHMDGRLSSEFYLMRKVSVSFAILSCVVTVALTMERFDYRIENKVEAIVVWEELFYRVDMLCLAYFVFEFCLRQIATKGKHLLSIAGLCDVLSLVGIFMTTCLGQKLRDLGFHPDYDKNKSDDIIVPLRLLRCFCLESYTHALHTIKNVTYVNRKALAYSFYSLVCIWWTFATCLYLTERRWPGAPAEVDNPKFDGKPSQDHENAEPGDELTMEDRYSDVLTALQYALVHITGDYPIADYKLRSMPLHFVFVILGMCCVAAFTGIFTAGFRNYLEDDHAVARRAVARQRLDTLTSSIIAIQYRFRRKRKLRSAVYSSEEIAYGMYQHPFQTIRDLVQRKEDAGVKLIALFNIILVVNLINTLLSSVDEVEWHLADLLETIELVCALVFTFEYLLRLMAASPPGSNILEPFRIIDLLCLAPSVLYFINGGEGMNNDHHGHSSMWAKSEEMEAFIDCAMIFRAVRIFDIPAIKKEARKTARAVCAISSSLFMPTILALNVWVFSASIFHWSENYYKGPEQENMSTIPSALYWTSIYIIGEWANVDFSPGAGSRLCIFYCLVAVCVFAIPVGIIADAVQDSVQVIIEERNELERLYGATLKDIDKTALTDQAQPTEPVKKLSLKPAPAGQIS